MMTMRRPKSTKESCKAKVIIDTVEFSSFCLKSFNQREESIGAVRLTIFATTDEEIYEVSAAAE